MGFLQIGSLSGFEKAVVSLWFRVPQASIDAADAEARTRFDEYQDDTEAPFVRDRTMIPQGYGAVPLLTWGAAKETYFYLPGSDGTLQVWQTNTDGPSCIFVAANETAPGAPPVLIVYFQSATTFVQPDDEHNPTLSDYYIIGSEYAPTPITADADVWHHLLTSWDISGGAGKVWLALDDVNYSGADSFGGETVGNDVQSFFNSAYPDAANFTWGTDEVGVPVPSLFSAYNREIEMAELQIYAGVTLDTSVEAKRRAFISAEGKPVPAKISRNDSGDLTAADDSPPVLLLGQLPNVAFVGSSSRWVSGKNLGTAGETFAKTGTIEPYKPDPKLGT